MKQIMLFLLLPLCIHAMEMKDDEGKIYELVPREEPVDDFEDAFTRLIHQQRKEIEEKLQQIERTYGTRDPQQLHQVYLNALQQEDHPLLATLKFLHVKENIKAIKPTSSKAFALMRHNVDEYNTQAVKFLRECGFDFNRRNKDFFHDDLDGRISKLWLGRFTNRSLEASLLVTLALANYRLTQDDQAWIKRNSFIGFGSSGMYIQSQGLIQSEGDLVQFIVFLKQYNIQKVVKELNVETGWNMLKNPDAFSLKDAARILVWMKRYPLPAPRNAFQWALHVIGNRDVKLDDALCLEGTLKQNGFAASEDPLFDLYTPFARDRYEGRVHLTDTLHRALAHHFIEQGALDTRPKKYAICRLVAEKGDHDIARLILQKSDHEACALRTYLYEQYVPLFDFNQLLPTHKQLPLSHTPAPQKEDAESQEEELALPNPQPSTHLAVCASTSALADTPRNELIAAVTKSSVRQRKSGTVATQEAGTIH